MKIMIALVSLFFCMISPTFAQSTDQSTEKRLKTLEESLRKQQQTIEELKTLQKTVRSQEKTIDEQRKLIDELRAAAKQPQTPAAAVNQTASAEGMQQQVQELKEKVDEVSEAQKKKLPSEFNPAIGLVGESVFSYRTKGSQSTGSDRPGGWDVNQRSAELNIAASVDPFAKGYAVLNASADPITGEATVGVEEAALQTTSLPWNLELKAGRFFGEFGRLAYIHDHELPFVNRPLVLDQYIGGESRTDGVQMNYLLPIPHYVSLSMGAGYGFGAAPTDINDTTNGDFRHFGGLSFFGRGSTYFDLTPNISLETGASGLWNPQVPDKEGVIALANGTPVTLPDFPGSTLQEKERSLIGVDFALNWKPLQTQSVPVLHVGDRNSAQ